MAQFHTKITSDPQLSVVEKNFKRFMLSFIKICFVAKIYYKCLKCPMSQYYIKKEMCQFERVLCLSFVNLSVLGFGKLSRVSWLSVAGWWKSV